MERAILHNVRVLDFSWVLAGPYGTRLLADFGAEVIKVQPQMAEEEDRYSQGYYNAWNRNKLGISLNLCQQEGIEIVKKLVKLSDVVVENFSPRVMANWGLDYPELKKIKPDIIFLSLSVMGHSGPWKDYVGFGPTVQAFSGITCLTGYPGQPPSGVGFSYADHVAGLYASLAIMGALEYRLKTGKGQYIDVSQTEAMTSLLADSIVDQQLQDSDPTSADAGRKWTGVNSSGGCRVESAKADFPCNDGRSNGGDSSAPYGVYPCRGKDRWCAIAVRTDGEWEGLKRALGNPKWASESRFATLEGRLKNVEALDNLVREWTKEHSPEEMMTLLQKEGVPAGVVQKASDLARDPQLKERGFLVELEHPVLGKTIADASPIHLSKSPAEYRRAAPIRRQDNDYVYRQLLGMKEEEIEKLRREDVI